MLKKLGLAAAAAVGLSLIATPALATPAANAPSPAGTSSCAEGARAPEIPEGMIPEDAAADAADAAEVADAAPAAAAPIAAPQGGPVSLPGWICYPRPQMQQQCVSQQSFPRPIPVRIPCFSGFSRPHFLGGGLSSLLDACLNLGLNLNILGHRGFGGLPFGGGGCGGGSFGC